jgi:hypothetical protein
MVQGESGDSGTIGSEDISFTLPLDGSVEGPGQAEVKATTATKTPTTSDDVPNPTPEATPGTDGIATSNPTAEVEDESKELGGKVPTSEEEAAAETLQEADAEDGAGADAPF